MRLLASGTRRAGAGGRRVLGEAFEQRQRFGEQLLLARREVVGDRPREPALAVAAVFAQRLQAVRGQLDERAAPVVGVGAARDQPVGLEVGDDLRHRLRAHALGAREIADRARPIAVEPAEHGRLREREAVALGAQPPDQMPEREAQPAGEDRRVERGRHVSDDTDPQGNCSVFLYNF